MESSKLQRSLYVAPCEIRAFLGVYHTLPDLKDPEHEPELCPPSMDAHGDASSIGRDCVCPYTHGARNTLNPPAAITIVDLVYVCMLMYRFGWLCVCLVVFMCLGCLHVFDLVEMTSM